MTSLQVSLLWHSLHSKECSRQVTISGIICYPSKGLRGSNGSGADIAGRAGPVTQQPKLMLGKREWLSSQVVTVRRELEWQLLAYT